MKYLIVAYKSRNNLYAFVKNLRLFGIVASIVNTPHNISSSCGLSARIDFRYLNSILAIVKANNDSLIGIYVCTRNGVFEQVEKIF